MSYLTVKPDFCKHHEEYALIKYPLTADKSVVLSENFALMTKLLKLFPEREKIPFIISIQFLDYFICCSALYFLLPPSVLWIEN